jgi:hypothetical protein
MKQLRGLIAVVGVLASAPAVAQDIVRLTWHSGYPMPRTSGESMTSEIRRHSSDEPESAGEVDRYFRAVRMVLDTAQAVGKWTPPPPVHAPMLKIEVTLGKRQHVLEAAWSERGPGMPLNPSEIDRRHFAAFESIVRLSMDHLESRWKPRTK